VINRIKLSGALQNKLGFADIYINRLDYCVSWGQKKSDKIVVFIGSLQSITKGLKLDSSFSG
jgi:hypothetical protein